MMRDRLDAQGGGDVAFAGARASPLSCSAAR